MSRWVKEWAKEGVSKDLEELSGPRRFGDLPRRWVVERTFSWLGQYRRMSKDNERLPESSEDATLLVYPHGGHIHPLEHGQQLGVILAPMLDAESRRSSSVTAPRACTSLIPCL
jgi:hypothetical protein